MAAHGVNIGGQDGGTRQKILLRIVILQEAAEESGDAKGWMLDVNGSQGLAVPLLPPLPPVQNKAQTIRLPGRWGLV
jgi:hypothetical protein